MTVLERVHPALEPLVIDNSPLPGFTPDDRYHSLGALPMRDEAPKSRQQQRYIEAVQHILTSELHKMDVDAPILPPERIHFLSSPVYTRDVSSSDGDYFPASHSATIRIGPASIMLSMLTEELLHAASYQAILISSRTQEPIGRRLGYSYLIGKHYIFGGFYEGVLNSIKRELLQHNLTFLQVECGLDDDEAIQLVPTGKMDRDYPQCRKAVIEVALKVASRTNQDAADVLKRAV